METPALVVHQSYGAAVKSLGGGATSLRKQQQPWQFRVEKKVTLRPARRNSVVVVRAKGSGFKLPGTLKLFTKEPVSSDDDGDDDDDDESIGTQKFSKLPGTLKFPGRQQSRPKNNNVVFVAGATGKVGQRIVRELLQLGLKVRAGVRNADTAQFLLEYAVGTKEVEKSPSLWSSFAPEKLFGFLGSVKKEPRVELVEVDLEKSDEIELALGNAGIVICAIGASEKDVLDVTGPYRIDFKATENLINSATSAKVNHFVLVTSLGTNKIGWPAAILNLFWGVLLWKAKAEKALTGSGIPFTIVRPGGMERPTDAYKETHNLVLDKADSRFGGQVSNLQVAELIAGIVSNLDLAQNKILEVVAETTAPLRPIKDLLSEIPSIDTVEIEEEEIVVAKKGSVKEKYSMQAEKRAAKRREEEGKMLKEKELKAAKEREVEAKILKEKELKAAKQRKAEERLAAERCVAEEREKAEALREKLESEFLEAKEEVEEAKRAAAAALLEKKELEKRVADIRSKAKAAAKAAREAKALEIALIAAARQGKGLSDREKKDIISLVRAGIEEEEKEKESKILKAKEAEAKAKASALKEKAEKDLAEAKAIEAEKRRKDQEAKAVAEAERATAKAEAERKAKEEAEAKSKAEAERKAKEVTEAKSKAEAEMKAKAEAKEKAKIEAELKAKAEAEEKAKIEAELKAKAEAEEKARIEMELQAKAEAEEKAKIEAELKAKAEAEERARIEAELKAKAEAEENARIEAELQAKAEAEEKAKIEAELKAKAKAEEKAKIEAELKAKAEAEEKAKIEAELKAKAEAEEKAKIESEMKAKEEAEEKEKAEAAIRAQAEAEEALRVEAERKEKEEAEKISVTEGEKPIIAAKSPKPFRWPWQKEEPLEDNVSESQVEAVVAEAVVAEEGVAKDKSDELPRTPKPLSPYAQYPGLKPPTSPTPSRPVIETKIVNPVVDAFEISTGESENLVGWEGVAAVPQKNEEIEKKEEELFKKLAAEAAAESRSREQLYLEKARLAATAFQWPWQKVEAVTNASETDTLSAISPIASEEALVSPSTTEKSPSIVQEMELPRPSRPLSPYTRYPGLKPPKSPGPAAVSQAKVNIEKENSPPETPVSANGYVDPSSSVIVPSSDGVIEDTKETAKEGEAVEKAKSTTVGIFAWPWQKSTDTSSLEKLESLIPKEDSISEKTVEPVSSSTDLPRTSRPLSPYARYPGLKPPTSPTPSTPKMIVEKPVEESEVVSKTPALREEDDLETVSAGTFRWPWQ